MIPYQDTQPWEEWTDQQKEIFAYEAGEWLLRCGFASEDEIRTWGQVRTWPEEDARLRPGYAGAPETPADPVAIEIHKVVDAALPPPARILIVSQGNASLLELGTRRAEPFPQTADGRDAGTDGCDDAEALAQLRSLQLQGDDFLLIPSPAFLWLEQCEGLRRFLEGPRGVFWKDERCLIYRLTSLCRA
jgi:hypothetical protein